MPYNQLTNLDYFDIRNSLRDYLRANSDFTDYDFEGSVLSNLLDVLAYNTYYTAFNANMVANEVFLDSATLRDNVVAIARQLGYIPRSYTSPQANVSINFDISSSTPIETVVFKRGSGFLTTIDNTLYQYVLQDDVKAPVINNTVAFNNIDIYEGTIVTNYYTVGNETLTILLDNEGIDTSTIRVNVYENQQSSSFEIYNIADNILTVTPSSKVFFVTEVEDENYRITFGDGVLGSKLTPGQYVEVSYLITAGGLTNSAKSFTFNGILEDENGNTPFVIVNSSITVNNPSFGGDSIESLDSIKKNAPAMFGTQNRAVTSDDYTSIVRRVYPSVADIYTYGGEEAVPPEYGKVKIVIKPTNASFLTSFTKKKIIDEIRKFSVGSVTPEIIDPSIVFIELNSRVFYQSSLTNKTPDSIKSIVIRNIENYLKNSDTEKFGGKFRYSRFISAIDSSDRSIRSNLTTITMRKDFYPSLNNKTFYELCFNNPFDKDCDEVTLMSTGFVVQQFPNFTAYIEDRDGVVVLYRLDPQTGDKIILNPSLGKINYDKGEIMLYDLNIIRGTFDDNKIEIRLRPKTNDIVAVREMFLDVDISNSKFTIIQE
jgi:hypothetical protein